MQKRTINKTIEIMSSGFSSGLVEVAHGRSDIFVKKGKINILQVPKIFKIKVLNRNTPAYTYHQAIDDHDDAMHELRKDYRKNMRTHRLLKIQAYIAYRVTK